MCDKQTLVVIPDWALRALEHFDETHPEHGLDENGRKCFQIDSCIVPALQAVWDAGFRTLGCCCGHGQGYGVISLDMGLFERKDVGKLLEEHHCPLCGQPHRP